MAFLFSNRLTLFFSITQLTHWLTKFTIWFSLKFELVVLSQTLRIEGPFQTDVFLTNILVNLPTPAFLNRRVEEDFKRVVGMTIMEIFWLKEGTTSLEAGLQMMKVLIFGLWKFFPSNNGLRSNLGWETLIYTTKAIICSQYFHKNIF